MTREAPTYLHETRGWGTPGLSFDGRGMTVEEVDEPVRWHVCGKCRQPGTNKGVAWCPNNREVV